MSTLLIVSLFLSGMFAASCIWAINIQLKRCPREARWGSLGGILIVFGIFLYTTHLKGGGDSLYVLIGLSVGATVVWILACVFAIGLLTIIGVGLYWLYMTLKHTSPGEFWERLKADFKEILSRLKLWIDGE